MAFVECSLKILVFDDALGSQKGSVSLACSQRSTKLGDRSLKHPALSVSILLNAKPSLRRHLKRMPPRLGVSRGLSFCLSCCCVGQFPCLCVQGCQFLHDCVGDGLTSGAAIFMKAGAFCPVQAVHALAVATARAWSVMRHGCKILALASCLDLMHRFSHSAGVIPYLCRTFRMGVWSQKAAGTGNWTAESLYVMG